ncbi:hypothetical protein WS90_24945 [Burkholderia cepacia]|uniref:Uncharacterized protein n=1 Tax=Burkholderia cepacia TaxID=292 RepID=A0A118KEN1_BURCE|nr:hypothetical protein WS90_24945 [Burkholderia cepacia]
MQLTTSIALIWLTLCIDGEDRNTDSASMLDSGRVSPEYILESRKYTFKYLPVHDVFQDA